jgi:4-amino-4-deoxy-L-arabinose transferase-like glycosyltransferase
MFFCFRVWGLNVALLTVFVAATTGHFTKYAATSMLEGPLAFGVLITSLGCYLALSSERTAQRFSGYLLLSAGILVASSVKGVVGWGAVGGVLLAFVLQIFVENRSLGRLLFVPVLGAFLFIVAAAPFLFWLLQTIKRPELLEWIHGYFFKQVLGSATTDRGEEFFRESKIIFTIFR